jgi:hypothetical protein
VTSDMLDSPLVHVPAGDAAILGAGWHLRELREVGIAPVAGPWAPYPLFACLVGDATLVMWGAVVPNASGWS